MEFNEVLEKRRTYRDYTNREVSDEIVKQVISAAFKAPTNDHLRQLEFVVVRGRKNIAKVIDPLAKIWRHSRIWCMKWMNRATRIRWICLPMPYPNNSVC